MSRFTIGKNHTNSVNSKGQYDIIEFLTDHREDFKYIYNVSVGKFESRVTTQIDCESLFSQAVHLAHPNCNRTTVKIFEMLVMSKHQI